MDDYFIPDGVAAARAELRRGRVFFGGMWVALLLFVVAAAPVVFAIPGILAGDLFPGPAGWKWPAIPWWSYAAFAASAVVTKATLVVTAAEPGHTRPKELA